ncbi:hypothetical protein QBC36DRAFT_196395 [Triangularia setosa]|uniref:Uncharacterized protein n=1 Tax=Triangularia setosa TaxID=2587417 RepID=A0AAN6VZM6_9PEZI|nr:hypothetical protein QBC36DRAFT_196395 [Podospora setosa]
MPLQLTNVEEQPPHQPPATPPILSTGSSPFQLSDTPTPATGLPDLNMGTPGGFGPPPAGSLSVTPAGPPSGSLFDSPCGSPQANLVTLQSEHISLSSRINNARDWTGYVTIPHTDIMRYIELSNILNPAQSNNPAQGQAVPSDSTASLNEEKIRLAKLDKSIREREHKLLQRERGHVEKKLVEAKSSLKRIEGALGEKKHELAALQHREAELTRREAEVLEQKVALDEREELLKAGEDGLEQQEEENISYAAKLVEREKLANAVLEKEKLIESEKASLQQQKEDMEKKNKTMSQVNKALVNKDMALAKREKALKAREDKLAKQEARAGHEAQNIEKMKVFLKATGAGQQAQYRDFEKMKAAFFRQHNYQSLPAQPPVQRAFSVQTSAQQALQLRSPQQQQASLLQTHQQQALSIPQQIPQVQVDTNQRVVLGYQYGWEAALPVGVEQGRRKATAHTTKLHVQHLQAVIARIRQIIHNHSQIMAGDIKIDLNALQKEIDQLIDLERDHADDVEMSFEEKFDATTHKDGDAVWEYIRTMSIEADCPIYYYFPANPESGAQPTAGIIKPAPPNTTPQSPGVHPVVVVGGNTHTPTNNRSNSQSNHNQQLPPSTLVSTSVPGPDVPTIQVTTPGGTDRPPTASHARCRGGGIVGMRVKPSTHSGLLQAPLRNYNKRARSDSPALEPAPKRSRGHPLKNKPVIAMAPTRSSRPTRPTAAAAAVSLAPPVPAPVRLTTGELHLLAPAPPRDHQVLAPPAVPPATVAGQENSPVRGPSLEADEEEEDNDEEDDEDEEEEVGVMYLAKLWGWMGPHD